MKWPPGLGLLAPSLIVLLGIAALYGATDGFRAVTEETARRLDVARTPRLVPAVDLEDMAGRHVALAPGKTGKISLVEFIYTTCPTVCQTAGEDFARLRDRLARSGLGDDVRLISVSFDPERDDQAALQSYARLHGALGRIWRVARMDTQDLAEIKQTFGLRVIPDEWGGFQHNTTIHVIDRSGRLSSILDIDDIEAAVRQVEDLL